MHAIINLFTEHLHLHLFSVAFRKNASEASLAQISSKNNSTGWRSIASTDWDSVCRHHFRHFHFWQLYCYALPSNDYRFLCINPIAKMFVIYSLCSVQSASAMQRNAGSSDNFLDADSIGIMHFIVIGNRIMP